MQVSIFNPHQLDRHTVQEIRDLAVQQPIFHNDLESTLFFFDFKYKDYWVSSLLISNDLKSMIIEIN